MCGSAIARNAMAFPALPARWKATTTRRCLAATVRTPKAALRRGCRDRAAADRAETSQRRPCRLARCALRSRGTWCRRAPPRRRRRAAIRAADRAETSQRRPCRSGRCALRSRGTSCRDTATLETVPYPCSRFVAAIHGTQGLPDQLFPVRGVTTALDSVATQHAASKHLKADAIQSTF